MSTVVGFLGFGEAAQTFTSDSRWSSESAGFDIKLRCAVSRSGKLQDFARCSVRADEIDVVTMSGISVCVSVVTADQTLAAAMSAARSLVTNTLYLDMNSSAPETKRAAAIEIERAGGCYVDVAVMAPVQPAALCVPLLVSGPVAERGHAALQALGFSNIKVVGKDVGRASSIKMIRSVMVKGIEALTAECLLAAEKAGVTQDVLSSLGAEWPGRATYNLDRMLVHGKRRAAEMEEVAKTLGSLGVLPLMTSGAIIRQRQIGELEAGDAGPKLQDKLSAIFSAPKVVAP